MLNHWKETPINEERDSTDKHQLGPQLWTPLPRSFLRGTWCFLYFESGITKMHTRPGLSRATLMSREGWVAKIRLPDQEQLKKPRKLNVRSSSCVRCMEKPNQPTLEQRKVHCSHSRRQVAHYLKSPKLAEGFGQVSLKVRCGRGGSREGCADQHMPYSPTGWWCGAGRCPRG